MAYEDLHKQCVRELQAAADEIAASLAPKPVVLDDASHNPLASLFGGSSAAGARKRRRPAQKAAAAPARRSTGAAGSGAAKTKKGTRPRARPTTSARATAAETPAPVPTRAAPAAVAAPAPVAPAAPDWDGKLEGGTAPLGGDLRARVRALVYRALRDGAPGERSLAGFGIEARGLRSVATEVEGALHWAHAEGGGGGGAAGFDSYSAHVRAVLPCLRKDPLRSGVLQGDVGPVRVASMREAELVSEAERSARQAAIKRHVDRTSAPAEGGAFVDAPGMACASCTKGNVERAVVSDATAAAKADTWGTGDALGTVVLCRCRACGAEWRVRE